MVHNIDEADRLHALADPLADWASTMSNLQKQMEALLHEQATQLPAPPVDPAGVMVQADLLEALDEDTGQLIMSDEIIVLTPEQKAMLERLAATANNLELPVCCQIFNSRQMARR